MEREKGRRVERYWEGGRIEREGREERERERERGGDYLIGSMYLLFLSLYTVNLELFARIFFPK